MLLNDLRRDLSNWEMSTPAYFFISSDRQKNGTEKIAIAKNEERALINQLQPIESAFMSLGRRKGLRKSRSQSALQGALQKVLERPRNLESGKTEREEDFKRLYASRFPT